MIDIITSSYSIDINSADMLENGDIKFSGSDGTYILYELKNKETYVYFITGIYEYIINNGFSRIAHVLPSRSGKYYIESNGKLYIAVKYTEPINKTVFYNSIDSIAELLGDFHKFSCGIIPPPGAKPETGWGKWTEKYRKKLQALRKFKYFLQQKTGKTAAEKSILDGLGFYMEKAGTAISLLQKSNYLDTIEKSMERREVSLNCVKASNFYKDDSGFSIRAINKCKYEIVERDIADLIDESIKGNCDITNILNIYGKASTRNINYGIIKAFLLFPEQYIKLCLRCKEGKFSCNDQLLHKKLNKITEFENRKIDIAETI